MSLMFRGLWDGLRNIANVLIIRNEFNKEASLCQDTFSGVCISHVMEKMSFNYKKDATLICYSYWKKMCN